MDEASDDGDLGWRGTINAWECDEMGRLEMRFYIALAWQAAQIFLTQGGKGAEAPRPVQQHIRFLRELRPNVPAEIRNRELDGGELLQVLRRCDSGELLAAIRTRFGDGELAQSGETLPDYTAYRGLDPHDPLVDRPVGNALTSGLTVVGAQDCDRLGRMRPELVVGKIAEATPHLMARFTNMAREATGLVLGGASVEVRLRYHRWPKDGDLVEVNSSLLALDAKTQRLGHWLRDPSTGEPYASGEIVALMFDLEARKMTSLPGAVIRAMRQELIEKGA